MDTEQTEYTVQNIQVAAFDITKFPDAECPMPERILWWTLRDVYARFKDGRISKERGEIEKQWAMNAYKRDAARMELYKGLVKHQAEMWQQIEQKGRNYAKSDCRSAEADEFYAAVYGCRPKDMEVTV